MYRQDLKDEFYTRKSKEEGYPARSVYKLKEIDEKYRVIRRGNRVLDLGCAPGSWLLYIAEKVGKTGKVLGIDSEDVKIKQKDNITFLKKNILELDESYFINMPKFHVLVADLAPKTSGVKSFDVGRSLELSETAFSIAKEVLVAGGNFICKIFEGADVDEFVKEVEKSFSVLKRVRPKAVIKHSKEFYIIAMGYRKN
ncbi:MAG: RlmE family RNA methyltransferase [Candidatus Staskawiczbacteria bacterium]|jgi:23S rRNA (uridine2552-2'-O)-methyltransferase